MDKQQIIKIIISVLIAALTALGAAFGLSCKQREPPEMAALLIITRTRAFYQAVPNILR